MAVNECAQLKHRIGHCEDVERELTVKSRNLQAKFDKADQARQFAELANEELKARYAEAAEKGAVPVDAPPPGGDVPVDRLPGGAPLLRGMEDPTLLAQLREKQSRITELKASNADHLKEARRLRDKVAKLESAQAVTVPRVDPSDPPDQAVADAISLTFTFSFTSL